jgi:cytochrome d ubiquinol oxidase subunit II
MHVILSGFDLGIGILFMFAESEHERDQMMNSVAPLWDLPVIVMLLALVFRGVAFN